MEEKKKSQNEEHSQSRRTFLMNSGLTVGSLIIGGAIGNFIARKPDSATNTTSTSVQPQQVNNHSEAMQFFTRKEDFDTLSAAVECIFPEDEHGPGAIGLGVPYFIDKQLSSPWGKSAEQYRKFPFMPGETPLNRGEIFIEGLRKLSDVSQQKHNATFSSLQEEQQIEILQMFEKGEVELKRVSSIEFFMLLRQSTLEGCYSDPLYGGNKNMEGWKMKEFPGAQMSYIAEVESDFKIISPLSLGSHNHQ